MKRKDRRWERGSKDFFLSLFSPKHIDRVRVNYSGCQPDSHWDAAIMYICFRAQ